jgi:hypothetical protein
MNAIDAPMRAAARAPLPIGAFLRVDRGEGLYVSDAPMRGADARALVAALGRADFDAWEARGRLHIAPRAAWMPRMTEAVGIPRDEQARLLARFEGRGTDARERAIWLDAVKFFEGYGADGARIERRIRQCAAAALRAKRGGEGLLHAYAVLVGGLRAFR